MKIIEIQNWLGKYFLIITILISGYILFCKETWLLPITSSEAMSVFYIMCPFLLGQVTIIFKWYFEGNGDKQKDITTIPVWAVKLPPILAFIIIALAILNLVLGNYLGEGKKWTLAAEDFTAIIALAISILNASTIYVILKVFKVK